MKINQVGWPGLALALVIGLTGCAGPKGAGEGKFAAVEIANFSRQSIATATQMVFERHGYERVNHDGLSQTFERRGTGGENLAQGTLEPGTTSVRVVTEVDRIDDSHSLLWCDAYFVLHSGDRTFEETKKMWGNRRGQYQELLGEVKALLEPAPPPKK